MPRPTPSAMVISLADHEIGVAIRRPDGFQFIASDPQFRVLDGSRFRRLEQLEQAAHKLARAVDQGAAGTRFPPQVYRRASW
ncbi:MAG TPA: hypothetical protein VFG43_01205 [Geminicoccaceae bacterium]|nr:hypothetical protein [Geminicoccaceae bacterium]